jgi:hypothetical protein
MSGWNLEGRMSRAKTASGLSPGTIERAKAGVKKWQAHPAASIFPLLQGADLRELTEDIRKHGLLEPIEIYEGKVIDGRNRLQACETAGIKPRFREAELDVLGPTEYVISKNLHRRHLTSSQRAAIATEALPILEVEAKERQRQHGDTAPGRVANTLPRNGESVPSPVRAGAALGVGHTYVEEAKALGRVAPELLEDVKQGKRTLPDARREVGLAPPLEAPPTKPSRDVAFGGQKRGRITAKERLRRLAEALSGYALGLEGMGTTPDCEEELDAVIVSARSIVHAAQRLRREAS